MRKIFFIFICLVFLSSVSSAYDFFKYEEWPEKTEDLWKFTYNQVISQYTGNTEYFVCAANIDICRNDLRTCFDVSGTFAYVESNSNVSRNKGNLLCRYDYLLKSRIETFFFSKQEYDKVNELDARNNTGVGLKYILTQNEYLVSDIGNAITYQYENYENEKTYITSRWSIRYRLIITPTSAITIGFICFYIPRVEDYADYRFDSDVYGKIRIDPIISWKVGYQGEYNSNPARCSKKQDNYYYTSLELTL